MTEKLYTAGQIAKKYHVSLKAVYEWRTKLGCGRGRANGSITIPNDPYGRSGIPESIVNLFPFLPTFKDEQQHR